MRVESLEGRLPLVGNLVISEIHFAPRAPAPGGLFVDASDFEFIELKNIGAQSLGVQGFNFSAGVTFTFGAMNIPAGSYAVLTNNTAAFMERYPGVAVAGEYLSDLANGGETLTLRDAQANILQTVAYDSRWYPATATQGHSLVVRDEAAAGGNTSLISAWRPSSRIDGSPGAVDVGLYPGAIVINELLAHQDIAIGDWLELHNTSPAAVNVGGWFLSDDPNTPSKYAIPANTVIPAGGFRTFTQVQTFGHPAQGLNAFAFSELADEAVLTAPVGPRGEVYGDTVRFDATPNGVTLGRIIKTDGQVETSLLASTSFAAANAGPLLGPIVISEFMYNPSLGEEFLELFNASNATVPLFDPLRPANTWKFTKGLEFTFPQNVSLPPGGYLLLVDADPAVFRAANNVPANVPIFSYSGAGAGLGNNGEEIELTRPGDPEPPDAPNPGLVPFYRVDRVVYSDRAPWPTSPDGNGPSLVRRTAISYGNDVVNWTVGVNGGSPGRSDPDLVGPRVIDVLVSGSSWLRPGTSAPAGVGQQLLPLPWINLNRITLVFNEPVVLAANNALAVSGVSVPSYAATPTVGLNVPGTSVTWTLDRVVAADRLLLDLENDRLRDVAGNNLDGDWFDDASVFPSGNGVNGADFRFRMNILPGDVDQNGVVEAADRMATFQRAFTQVGDPRYVPLADVDGNGKISAVDMVLVRNRQGSTLPPAASPAAADAAIAELAAESTTNLPATRTRLATQRRTLNETSPEPRPALPPVLRTTRRIATLAPKPMRPLETMMAER